jgi:eukaryotic-like serine/threonine-protein kinase
MSSDAEKAKKLFMSVMALEKERRAAYLAEASAGDQALRDQVQALIAAQGEAATVINAPARLPGDGIPFQAEARVIDSYRLVREIGKGGMGSVYLAVRADQQFSQYVALKLVKRGMDTDEVLRRFRHERQILAGLSHPNIARLLDGGATPDGLPYFVMEFIEGKPLDEYCDNCRLSVSERIQLFRMVCSAVHYAHQHLIVHRDLKPSNILVTAEGVPKLLDFGIAKLINPALAGATLEPTAAGFRPMTPEYASPEQARGDAITTASDIYSLGVLLYELLSGHRPYYLQSQSEEKFLKILCEQDPLRPSTAVTKTDTITDDDGTVRHTVTPQSVSATRDEEPAKLRRHLAGDLDNIVMMAMRKEPQRRYASVEQLSEDLRRHSEGLPVIARDNTFGYLTGKFVRRHKAGMAAAALVLLTLLGGIVATTWEARIAEAEREKAERRFNDVRQLANSLLFEIHDGMERLSGSTPVRALLVKRALEYLDRLSRESGGGPALQGELAIAYEKIGDIQGNPYTANLGDTAGAQQSYQKALSIRLALKSTGFSDPKFERGLADCYDRIGSILEFNKDLSKTLENYRRGLQIRESLIAANPASRPIRHDFARSLESMGDVLAKMGKTEEAQTYLTRALALRRKSVAENPADASSQRSLAIALRRLGDLQYDIGNLDASLSAYREAQPIFESLTAANPTDARARREVSILYSTIGYALAEKGDLPGAVAIERKALEIRIRLSQTDPQNAQARRDLAVIFGTLGQMLAETSEKAEAVRSMEQSCTIFKELSIADSTNVAARRDLAICSSSTGDVLSTLASKEKDSPDSRIVFLQRARNSYLNGRRIYFELKNSGVVRPSDIRTIERISARIAGCDAELGKLKTGR